MINPQTIDKLKRLAENSIHSGFSQDVRIEWRTLSGGTLDVVWDVKDGATVTDNILDTKGILSLVNKEDARILEKALVVNHDAVWLLDTNVNLKNRNDFILAQFIKNEYYDGTGTGSSSTWTDTSASWTTDQWAGFWLVFSNKRFLITANTATTLTVTLDGDTLPTSSTSYEIFAVKEWFPVIPDPAISDVMETPIGDSQLLQQVYVNQVPTRGT